MKKQIKNFEKINKKIIILWNFFKYSLSFRKTSDARNKVTKRGPTTGLNSKFPRSKKTNSG